MSRGSNRFHSFGSWSQDPKLVKAIQDFRRNNWESIPRAPRILKVPLERLKNQD